MSRISSAREPSSGAILTPPADREHVLRSPTILGSDPAHADVVIADPSVSARHAVIELDAGDRARWKIRDLGSTHGTLVDGERIIGERILNGQHELQLGRSCVTLVVERAVRLIETSSGEVAMVRGESAVVLEPIELAFVRVLAVAQAHDATRPEIVRGFVRSSDLAHLATGAADLAIPLVRQLARRLERKLAGLGGTPVLEACERRGYRLRARLANEAG